MNKSARRLLSANAKQNAAAAPNMASLSCHGYATRSNTKKRVFSRDPYELRSKRARRNPRVRIRLQLSHIENCNDIRHALIRRYLAIQRPMLVVTSLWTLHFDTYRKHREKSKNQSISNNFWKKRERTTM